MSLKPLSDISRASFIIGIKSLRSSSIEKYLSSLSPGIGEYE